MDMTRSLLRFWRMCYIHLLAQIIKMKNLLSLITLIFSFSSCISQSINGINSDFNLLYQHFKKNNHSKDNLIPPFIHQNDNFSIQFDNQSLNLKEAEIQLSNPFSGGSFPLAFSILFNGHLISLFDNGKFVCHTLTNFKRNQELEEKLNTRKFDYAWIIDGSIIAKYNYEYFKFTNSQEWIEYSNVVPFCNKNIPFDCKSKLFEDSKYLVYQKCQGKWGGIVFFYNKNSKKTYQNQATCANSIIKKDSVYYVLSHLGHMSGTSDLQKISNPDEITQTRHVPNIFDFWEIQTFSSFEYDDQTIYLVYWRDATFLATYEKGKFLIVDPLFNNDLYTHDPVTTSYDKNLILINLDFYGVGQYREVACILIEDNNLTKINWKEK